MVAISRIDPSLNIPLADTPFKPRPPETVIPQGTFRGGIAEGMVIISAFTQSHIAPIGRAVLG
ncbi:hypothetical protein B0H19DRAFT_1138512 [Mycena capillaripes]|nr:hypothetical protein B0H19DRAFT_1138512 [Mycena capillaripes]